MQRVRYVLGSLLALAGAAAVVWSPFRAWYDGRLGRDYRIGELFSPDGVTDAKAELFGSLFLPYLFVAVVTLLGVVLRSRLMLAVAGIVAMGFAVLWMVRVGQAQGSIAVDGDGNGLDVGVANAFVGGAVILLASLIMSPRRRRHTAPPPEPAPTVPTLDHPTGPPPTPFTPYDDQGTPPNGTRTDPPLHPPVPPHDTPPEAPPPWHRPPPPPSGS